MTHTTCSFPAVVVAFCRRIGVDAKSEHAGLDVSEHGENAYNQ